MAEGQSVAPKERFEKSNCEKPGLNIGIVEYINALPFHLPFRLGELQTKATFTYGIPSELNRQLHEGKLDIALTSSVEYFNGSYQLLPGYCIGAHKEILSVNLYIRGEQVVRDKNFDRKVLEGAQIGLTHHSGTSIALLKVLCAHFWKVKPNFVPLTQNEVYDGFLLIGDDALKKLTIPGYQTIDLATAWYEATQLPFVFALITMREDISYKADEFEKALQWSETHREYLVDAAHKQCGLPKALINRYYDVCKYRLGENELEGLHLFQSLSKHV